MNRAIVLAPDVASRIVSKLNVEYVVNAPQNPMPAERRRLRAERVDEQRLRRSLATRCRRRPLAAKVPHGNADRAAPAATGRSDGDWPADHGAERDKQGRHAAASAAASALEARQRRKLPRVIAVPAWMPAQAAASAAAAVAAPPTCT